MIRTNCILFTALLVGLSALGSHGSLRAQSSREANQLVATMFDEFGSVGYCDLTARLDNFAISLQNSPKFRGYIVAYAPPDRGPRIVDLLKDYLINTRGLTAETLNTIYAGRNNVLSELRTQLWLVPEGALPPEPEKFNTNPETFKGMFYEQKGWDEIPYPGEEIYGDGFSLRVSVNAFTDVLKQQPHSVVYVVGYNGEVSTPGAWRRIAENEIEYLKSGGFEATSFKIIYGGEVKEAKVQVWIQPASDPPPAKEAGSEPIPKATLQLGDYGNSELGYEKYERAAFNRLVDTLRSFPGLRACVIVRGDQPKAAVEEFEEEDPPADIEQPVEPVAKAEPEPADLFKLAEQWKSELASTYKIREDRFVVLFSKARPEAGSTFETWLIPPGEPFPDPDALLEDEQALTEANSDPTQQFVSTSDAQPRSKPLIPVSIPEETGKASVIPTVLGKKP